LVVPSLWVLDTTSLSIKAFFKKLDVENRRL